MLIQIRDSYGDWCVVGTGAVYTPAGKPTVIESIVPVGNNGKLSFLLTAKVKKVITSDNGNYKFDYVTINCALYENATNKEQYALLKTLQDKERVVVYGTMYTHNYNEQEHTKSLQELRVESILFPNRIAALLYDGSITKYGNNSVKLEGVETKTPSSDEYDFD